MPAWFRELCPSTAHLALVGVDLSTTPASRPAPTPHRSLQRLIWKPLPSLDTATALIRRHVRQQLAALPSLTSLTARDLDWAAGPALVSGSVTCLELYADFDERQSPPLLHLPAQFPNLSDLDGWRYLVVRDADLRTLLTAPHLQTLGVSVVALQDSHRGGPWPQRLDLYVQTMHVDSFALLPLDRIAKCSIFDSRIMPSSDAARAARVAAAFGRWRTFRAGRDGHVLLRFAGGNFPPLLTSLPPFLRAVLPEPVTLDIVEASDLTLEWLRRLAPLLASHVRVLRFTSTSFTPSLWPRLLPSLPPSVATLELTTESIPWMPLMGLGQLRSLCLGAVRPIKVVVCTPGRPDAEVLVHRVLAAMGNAPAAHLVSLVAQD